MRNRLFNRRTRHIVLTWVIEDKKGNVRVMAKVGEGKKSYIVKLNCKNLTLAENVL